MNAVTTVTGRTAWSNRGRLAMTSAAIVASVSFMAAVLMLTGGLSSRGTGGHAAAYRGTAVVVHGETLVPNPPGEFITQSGAPLAAALRATAAAVPGVSASAVLVTGSAVLERLDGTVIGHPSTGGAVGYGWITDPRLNPYRLTSGQPPARAGQVVVDRAAARSGHLGLGSRIQLAAVTGRYAVTVVGIADYGDVPGPFFTTATLLPPQLAAGMLGSAGRVDQILLAGVDPPRLAAAVARAVASAHAVAVTGTAWAHTQEAARSTTLTFEAVLLVGFAVVALLVGGTLISTTFTVTVARRTRELALLRAIGATRRQVLASVLGEAAVVGLAGSALGTAAGVGVAYGLTAGFGALNLTLFQRQPVVTVTSVGLPLLVGVLSTVAAAVLPGLRASSISPVAALRRPDLDESAASTTRRLVAVALLLAAALVTVAGISANSTPLSGLGIALALVGVVVAGPTLVHGFSVLFGAPMRAAFGPTGLIAARAASRSPRRTAATANALMLGVALVILVSALVGSVNASTASSAARAVHANYVVTSSANWRPQVGDSTISRLRSTGGVRTVSPVYLGTGRVDAASAVLGATDPASIASVWSFGWSAGSLASVTASTLAVRDRALAGHHLGDTVQVTLPDGFTQNMRIGAVFTNDFPGFNSPGYLVPEALFHAHAAQPGAQLALVSTADGTTAAALRLTLGADDSLVVAPARSWATQGNTKANELRNLFDALDGLAVLLALIGVLNTTSLAVQQRQHEFGALRAVGVTRGQLRRLITVETLLLGLYSVALGAGLGLAGAWALSHSSTDSELSSFTVPVATVLVSCAAGIAASALLVTIPARGAARTPILTALSRA